MRHRLHPNLGAFYGSTPGDRQNGVCFPGVSTSRVQHSLSSRFAFAQSVPLGPIVREHQGKPERRPPPLGSDRRIILTYPSPVLPPVSRPQ